MRPSAVRWMYAYDSAASAIVSAFCQPISSQTAAGSGSVTTIVDRSGMIWRASPGRPGV